MSQPSPYQSPKLEHEPPPVRGRPPLWWLFQIYTGLMTLLYFALAVLGAFLLFLSVSG